MKTIGKATAAVIRKNMFKTGGGPPPDEPTMSDIDKKFKLQSNHNGQNNVTIMIGDKVQSTFSF